jgi:hypothetical protein
MKLRLALLTAFFGLAISPASADPQYATSTRIQISEPCSSVAKWLTQGLSAGPHWELIRYDAALGLLDFRVLASGNLNRTETKRYVEGNAKNVHMDEVVFTLRLLVTSTLMFDNSHDQDSAGGSCTLAAAIKFYDKNGTPVYSTGQFEKQILDTFRVRYSEHGLDY